MPLRRQALRTALVLLLLFLLPLRPAAAYSVLSHEEVVDLVWLTNIVPMLRTRFPAISDAEVLDAHAYAYGGSVIQDIGYYPFGSPYYSDLLHYVRTGDFVSNLIRESSNPNEYAFALGALAHYCGDVYGHPAVNMATADEFPKLRQRFGRSVTYDQDRVAHLRTEFGFDVVQVAHGRYSQASYRDFIGFQVAKPLLERAFHETYGIPMDSVMTHEDLAISTYRRAVSSIIPRMTEVALVTYKGEIAKENPGFDKTKFVYRLRRTEFEKEYGREYIHPGVGTRFVAFVIEHLPKVGPLKALKLSLPTADEQDIYIKSINSTVDHYKLSLGKVVPPIAMVPGLPPAPYPVAPVKLLAPSDLQAGNPSAAQEQSAPENASHSAPSTPASSPDATPPPSKPLPAEVATPAPNPSLPASIAAPTPFSAVPLPSIAGTQQAPDLAEIDLDTGSPSRFGEYHLADLTYARLLNDLLRAKAPLTPDVQQSFKDFYQPPRTEPAWYVAKPRDWITLQTDLTAFDALPPPPPAPPLPPAGVPAPAPPPPPVPEITPTPRPASPTTI